MLTTEELQKQKERLVSALRDVNVALTHPEYANPFEFKRMDRILPQNVNHPAMKKLAKKCVETGSGFDPSLITQHIESVALDRFNKLVLKELEGLSIADLMAVRHEMELLMLTERYEHYVGEIEKIDVMLMEEVTGVSTEVAPKAKAKKKK
jgi:hypothetical protein